MRAVVIGGGVAGSASAIALARIGAQVTVYEAYEDPAGTVGSFVSLSVNGLRALGALGVLPEVQRAGFAVERQRMWSGRGRPLGDAPRGRRSGDPLLSVTLMRADLVRVLREEATRSGARVITGHRLTMGTSSGDAAVARTGHPCGDPSIAGADVVVGADGIWSVTRKLLDPASPEPAYAGIYALSGVARGVAAIGSGFNMLFARRGAFIHLPAPDGTVWWAAQVAAAEPPADVRAVGLGELAGLFPEEPVTAVLRGATEVGAATLLHVLRPAERRQDGRTVLVGDAAHPVGAGQGASMAIEDAAALAHALATAGDVPTALAEFDRVRHDRTGRLVKVAAANRDAKTAGPLTARLRELVMPYFFGHIYERTTGWLYDHTPAPLPRAGALD
ncbi:FAD-dependent oxidoreductase [Spongiactinospora sp. 9N601]|uniref:FAD-dependent oxidoreductase n=1 Tax=Spongiactinospora sp. 9N601 TaxID=3375149 RepID=UPI0037952173